MPLRIFDGGDDGAPDAIEIMRSDAAQGVGPIPVVQDMTDTTDPVVVGSGISSFTGEAAGGSKVLAVAEGGLYCSLMAVTGVNIEGNTVSLSHDADVLYNAGMMRVYAAGDSVVNLGNLGLRRFQVVCDGDDGEAPSATNNCVLNGFDPLSTPGGTGTVESIASQVVDFQAQYGIGPIGTGSVNQWVDATDAWAGELIAGDMAQIKAIRVAIVTRTTREGAQVSPAALTLWEGRDRELTDEERNFRYQVVTAIIPLINMIWADS
jgi:hypothetical protein